MALAIGLAAAAWLAAAGGPAAAEPNQAPFGDMVSPAIVNYNRASPYLGSAGLLVDGGVAEAWALGFVMIVDLRAPEEGILSEQQDAEMLDLRYENIPVSSEAPTEAQVSRFAQVVEDPANLPLLFHCKSANRAGAIWALYRASKGVPPEIAIEEGRTLGMQASREAAVRERLGLPPLTD